MNKNELLKKINSSVYEFKKAIESMYNGKTFACASSYRLDTYKKTKRGAEGYIKRLQSNSYYDESTFEMVTCGSGLQVIEIKETDLISIDKNIQLWLNEVRSYLRNFHNSTDQLIKDAYKYLDPESELFAIVIAAAESIEKENFFNYDSFENLLNTSKKEEAKTIQETRPATQNIQEVEINLNDEKNGIEIKFNSIPDTTTRTDLKVNGFRWSKFSKVWYAKQSEKTINFANSLVKKEEIKNTDATEIKEIKETLETKVNNFVKLIQNDHIERMQNSSSNFVDVASSDFRKKYILVDLGTSGRYMIDKETQVIYGVKAYGTVNKNKIYGTLDTINSYFWGDYYAFKLKEDRKINYNNLLTIENLNGKIFEATKSFMVDDEIIFDAEIVENEINEEEKNNLISIAEEYKKEILKDEKIQEEKQEEKIFFSIYGEGKTEDIKTYDIKKATDNFNNRIKFAVNSDFGGYYKTFIVLTIPELGEKNIKFRYDLDSKSEKTENILKFIIAEEKASLKYFKENMYSFTWIKDKEKYIKQHEELFLILEKYLNENNPIDPDKNKNKENILNYDEEKNNLISLNSMEEVESVKASHAPNSNVKILEFKNKRHDQQQEKNNFSIEGNKLNSEDKKIFENLFNDAITEIEQDQNNLNNSMQEKNIFNSGKIVSFDNLKNKKSNNDLNDYSFDAPSSNKNNSDKKIKMCVCGAILKTEKEKNLNICECCIDYAYSLYINRQLPPDVLKMTDELLKQEKKKEYNLMLDELQEEFNNLKK